MDHSNLPESSIKRIELQTDIVRELVETASPTLALTPGILDKLSALKAMVSTAKAVGVVQPVPEAKDVSAILMSFAGTVITGLMGNLIQNIQILFTPASGAVSWYNHTNSYVRVKTFDEKDAVRWIPYEERLVAPKQAVALTARGNTIHIVTASNGATYDCVKGVAYLFNGTQVLPKD